MGDPRREAREDPQPLSALRAAPRVREVVSGFWLVSLAAFLLGVISVVAPLRLDELGWGALGISAAFLISAGIEAAMSPVFGRWSDRHGRLAPVRTGLVAAIAISLVIPWWTSWPYLVLVICAGVAYGVNWVPGTALLSDGAERPASISFVRTAQRRLGAGERRRRRARRCARAGRRRRRRLPARGRSLSPDARRRSAPCSGPAPPRRRSA